MRSPVRAALYDSWNSRSHPNPAGGAPGARSVPYSTFSGYHSSHSRMTMLSGRAGSNASCSEKSAYTFGFDRRTATSCVYGPAPPCNRTKVVLRREGSSRIDSSSIGRAPARSKGLLATLTGMNVNGQAQSARLAGNYAKEKILDSQHVSARAGIALRIPPVNPARLSVICGTDCGSKFSERK